MILNAILLSFYSKWDVWTSEPEVHFLRIQGMESGEQGGLKGYVSVVDDRDLLEIEKVAEEAVRETWHQDDLKAWYDYERDIIIFFRARLTSHIKHCTIPKLIYNSSFVAPWKFSKRALFDTHFPYPTI